MAAFVNKEDRLGDEMKNAATFFIGVLLFVSDVILRTLSIAFLMKLHQTVFSNICIVGVCVAAYLCAGFFFLINKTVN